MRGREGTEMRTGAQGLLHAVAWKCLQRPVPVTAGKQIDRVGRLVCPEPAMVAHAALRGSGELVVRAALRSSGARSVDTSR